MLFLNALVKGLDHSKLTKQIKYILAGKNILPFVNQDTHWLQAMYMEFSHSAPSAGHSLRRKWNSVEKEVVCIFRKTKNSGQSLPAMWSWVRHLFSLNLNFFNWKKQIIQHLLENSVHRKWHKTSKALRKKKACHTKNPRNFSYFKIKLKGKKSRVNIFSSTLPLREVKMFWRPKEIKWTNL